MGGGWLVVDGGGLWYELRVGGGGLWCERRESEEGRRKMAMIKGCSHAARAADF